jgi:hypothetical protein
MNFQLENIMENVMVQENLVKFTVSNHKEQVSVRKQELYSYLYTF